MPVLALIQRILHQLKHDRRTLALLFIAPLFLLTLVSFILNHGTDGTITLAAVNCPPALYRTLRRCWCAGFSHGVSPGSRCIVLRRNHRISGIYRLYTAGKTGRQQFQQKRPDARYAANRLDTQRTQRGQFTGGLSLRL